MEDMRDLTAEQQAELLRHELEAVYGSSSYKIGRAITWLPRNAYRGLKYFLHNGPVVCVKYIYTYSKYHTIANENYAYWACLQKKDYPEALKKWYQQNYYEHVPLNLDHPVTFNEKTQWMKLYGNLQQYSDLVDKYKVRSWIKEKIGEEYLIPLLGKWDSFDEINFDELPNEFVLKTNHGAGWNYLVPDKSKMDKQDAKRKFDTWLKLNYTYYSGGLEVQYEKIRPCIIAEAYMKCKAGFLADYKFFCMNGEPQYVVCILNRYTDQEFRAVYYDMDWKEQPFTANAPLEENAGTPRPQNFEKMVELARTLSRGMPLVRVDLYSLDDGTIKFGEMTYTSEGGINIWYPASANKMLGDLLALPEKTVTI